MSSIFLESENFDFDDSLNEFFENSSAKKFEKPPENTENFDKELLKKPINLQKKSEKNLQKTSVLRKAENHEENPIFPLVNAMKTSFLPREDNVEIIRQVLLFSHQEFPLFLLRKAEESVLIGSGFSDILHAGKIYKTFADMRLPFSEAKRIQGWILTDENLDLETTIAILELLDFPVIYASNSLISRMRDFIEDKKLAKVIEKIRFREIFSANTAYNIAGIDFDFSDNSLAFSAFWKRFSYNSKNQTENNFIFAENGFMFNWQKYEQGEILAISSENICKKTMKFTFDTFYLDGKSAGTMASFPFVDRKTLSESGVLIFTLEENPILRTISGHIFIDSRGFVYPHELMRIHKELIKAIREIYEATILSEPQIERVKLIQILRRDVAKFCFVLTGRTPIIMPIIIDKK